MLFAASVALMVRAILRIGVILSSRVLSVFCLTMIYIAKHTKYLFFFLQEDEGWVLNDFGGNEDYPEEHICNEIYLLYPKFSGDSINVFRQSFFKRLSEIIPC